MSINTARELSMPLHEDGVSQAIGASINPTPPPESTRTAPPITVNKIRNSKLMPLLCASFVIIEYVIKSCPLAQSSEL
ncbi:Uncharacterised protein [Legionella cherrii]|uniref:Uncharacterized protein n=1 Tax=Legionella cherrii TaxID=28084 RepID=A0A0W0SB45_9GAMM|nr:hypothetical protein Lche_2335 [Legionella cherrii]VEB38907.1 Uncharacterised protein [Legionella cherrii]